MAVDDRALRSDELVVESWELQKDRGFPLGAIHAIVQFSKRKPLGAVGGVLVLVPLFSAIFLPGFDLGIVRLPNLLPYHFNEYPWPPDKVLEGPSLSHPFGTDERGRDLFSRLIYGSRLSFMIGFGVFIIATTLSTTLTIISAYYIRTVDLFLQRIVEIIGFLPDLVLIIALFSIYGSTPVTLILTLGVLNGINTGRVLRSLVIGVKGMPFIESARSIGASDARIIIRHVMPQVAFWIIVSATTFISIVIVVESGLAILGFGIDPGYPSLGNLLNNSRNYLRDAPHLAIFPGMVIFMILLGSRLLGDALRDVLDPRLRGSR
jgi:peptide/nickel transport system permease protein